MKILYSFVLKRQQQHPCDAKKKAQGQVFDFFKFMCLPVN